MSDMVDHKDETALVIVGAVLLATWLLVVFSALYVGWHFTMKYW
jgi:hypothetical protein